MESEYKQSNVELEGGFDFIKFLMNCLRQWPWFIISVIVCVGIAAYKILTTPPVYQRTSSVMIKSDSRGRATTAGDAMDFSSFGLVTSNTSVVDETQVISSMSTMLEVVRRLHLDMNYMEDDHFYDKVLYGPTLPFTAEIYGLPAETGAKFDVDIVTDSTIRLSGFVFKKEKFGDVIECAPGDTVHTPVGSIVITPTIQWRRREKPYNTIHISKVPLYSAASAYLKRFDGQLSTAGKNAMRQSSIVFMTQTDVCITRADDILRTILAVYNENWMKDKNLIATSTSYFINDRLAVIEQELARVDENIAKYKGQNQLPDVQSVSNAYFTEKTALQKQIQDLSNELFMTRYIREYLVDEKNINQILPSNTGISSVNIESQIGSYNQQVLKRTKLVASTSERNPLVQDLDAFIAAQRQAIIISVDNQILSLETQIANLQANELKTQNQLTTSPSQAKYLQDVERQQKVKESLYLFLLQKREENELSQAFTPYNTRIIDNPGGSPRPISPKKMQILLIAFVLGLAIPVGVIYLIQATDTAVHSKKDLSSLTVPFLGEIPQVIDTKKSIIPSALRKKKKKLSSSDPIVVKAGNRNYINEAFRVLRTNIEFVTEGNGHNIIALTSFNPGSGKSFLTINIALSLAIKDKKVLVIDGDFRHASLSAFINSPKRGFANYLAHQVDSVKDLICQDEFYKHLSVLPVGTLPPNPTELIATSLFSQTVEELAKEYDYVFIDCPPVDIVADTQIIGKCTDRVIFVVRAGLFQKSMLSELQNIYNEERFKNLTLVLNGTEGADGTYSYGKRYGYRYGYGYGYYGNNRKSYYQSSDSEDEKA